MKRLDSEATAVLPVHKFWIDAYVYYSFCLPVLFVCCVCYSCLAVNRCRGVFKGCLGLTNSCVILFGFVLSLICSACVWFGCSFCLSVCLHLCIIILFVFFFFSYFSYIAFVCCVSDLSSYFSCACSCPCGVCVRVHEVLCCVLFLTS